MGKAKRNRQRRSQRRNASSLDEHQRHRKTLTPPMMTLDRLKPTRWQHERLPDFLWLQAIRDETSDLSTANEALDILDSLVPRPTRGRRRAASAARPRRRAAAEADRPPRRTDLELLAGA